METTSFVHLLTELSIN